VIEEDKGKFYIRDCDSLNGTIVNHRRVGRALLRDGDEIQVGKHRLVFRTRGAKELVIAPEPDGFDQTMVMQAVRRSPAEANPIPVRPAPDAPAPGVLDGTGDKAARPRLIERRRDEDRVFEIGEPSLTLGSDIRADVEVGGFLVAKKHAEIRREDGHYVIRHLSGMRKVTVDGQAVKERILKNNDHIRIGNKEFVFQE
jgi:pSer/pThr/pTyr-binding forkhead associated (FHA) protein